MLCCQAAVACPDCASWYDQNVLERWCEAGVHLRRRWLSLQHLQICVCNACVLQGTPHWLQQADCVVCTEQDALYQRVIRLLCCSWLEIWVLYLYHAVYHPAEAVGCGGCQRSCLERFAVVIGGGPGMKSRGCHLLAVFHPHVFCFLRTVLQVSSLPSCPQDIFFVQSDTKGAQVVPPAGCIYVLTLRSACKCYEPSWAVILGGWSAPVGKCQNSLRESWHLIKGLLVPWY